MNRNASFKRACSAVFSLTAICLLVTLSASCKQGPDISTPKKAATAFAKAMQEGDMAALRKTATGTDADFTLLSGISDLSQAGKRFQDACTKKFGDQGKTQGPFGASSGFGVNINSDLENSEEKIDGDTATLVTRNPNNPQPPLALKKDADGWKVDLSAMSKNPVMPMLGGMMKPMLTAYDNTTKGVEDGKFKSAAEAQLSLGNSMNTAASSGLH